MSVKRELIVQETTLILLETRHPRMKKRGVFAIYMLRNFQSIEDKEVNLLGELEQEAPCTICTEHIEMQI